MSDPNIDKITLDIGETGRLIEQISEQLRTSISTNTTAMRQQLDALESVAELDAILTGTPDRKKH